MLNEAVRLKAALADAVMVREVQDIRNKAIAMRAEAQQAKDKSMEEEALGIRRSAEHRLDQIRDEARAAKDTPPHFDKAAALIESVESGDNPARFVAEQIHRVLENTHWYQPGRRGYDERDLTDLREACLYAAQRIDDVISKRRRKR
jgi:hypothetical protein